MTRLLLAAGLAIAGSWAGPYAGAPARFRVQPPAVRSRVAARYSDDRGRGSGYTRSDLSSGVDIDERRVESLLVDRNAARAAKRFDQADAIREELTSMGVAVWDRDRAWSADGNAPTRDNNYQRASEHGRANNFYRNNQRGRDNDGGFDDAPRQRRYAPSPPKEWNEWGHDYSRSEDDQSKSIDGEKLLGINDVLRRRLEAKFERDFAQADALLRDGLYEKYGVTVNDGQKLWRADGQSFERKYKRVGRSDGDLDESLIQQLIAERQAARKERNYHQADEILATLHEVHGIVLVDREWTWRYVGDGHDGNFGEGSSYARRNLDGPPKDHDYDRDAEDSTPIAADLLARIDDLLAQRLHKKKQRLFEEADALQDELWDLGVDINDRARLWRMELNEDA